MTEQIKLRPRGGQKPAQRSHKWTRCYGKVRWRPLASDRIVECLIS